MQKFYIRKNIALIMSFLILTTISCSRKGDKTIDQQFSRYIAAFTSGTISSTSSIQIELNQDIPTVELNKEIPEELFEISPKVKGHAYWTSNRTIKFVPEPGELKQGQTYDAWFKLDKVLDVPKDFKEFYFYFNVPEQHFKVDLMPYTQMKDNDLIWNTVQGTLSLADEASIDDISKMFSISGTSVNPSIKISPSNIKGRYNITIDSLIRKDVDSKYILEVDGSTIKSKDDKKQLEINIPAINKNSFSVIDVRYTYEPSECIRITFSDPLSNNQNIQGLIVPNGVENYSYDINKNVLKLYVDNLSTTNVDLNLYKELKTNDGRKLDKDYYYSLAVEKNKPEVKLLNNMGNILPDAENLSIPIQAVNLWAVDVSIVKIYENNILSYLQSNDFGGDSELRRFGRLILKKRIRLDKDQSIRLDQWNTFNIDLSTLIKKDPGAIYRIQFSIRQEYSLYPCEGIVPQIPETAEMERFDSDLPEEDNNVWDVPNTYYYDSVDWNNYVWEDRDNPCKSSYYSNRTTSCIVLSSNMGIIAKIGSDKKVLVALTDILSTKPISGADVDVYNFQMQEIGTGKTNSDGFVEIDYKGSVPFAVIVSKDKDKGYLKLTSNVSLSLSNFDVSGKEIEKGLKGYIYGERGVWRPGDTIFLTFILDDINKTLPKDHPVSLEFYTPTGQLYEKQVTTSAQNGFYPFKLKTDVSSPTGNWRVILKVGGATFSKTIKVETVKPNRLKVRLKIGDVIDASSGYLNTALSSQWLHGAPASNLKASVEMSLSTVSKPFKGYEDYSFNNPASSFYSDTYTIFEGNLDSQGDASLHAKLPAAENAPGMLKANFISRVFETGGDASIYMQTAAYSPFPAYIGIKSPAVDEYKMLETDTDNIFNIVSLNANGKPVNLSDINVKVYKINWSWWWNNNSDDLSSYINSTSANIILDKDLSTINGKATFKLKIDYPDWGRYLVIATDKNGGHISGKVIYVDWPSWRGRSDKQDPNGLTMLSFSTDKQTYNVGEKATVILPKSSNGRALISIESGSKIISRTWVDTKVEEDTKYTFEVTKEMNPNFYIFATLLQPYAQTNNDLPIRMYGVLNVSVNNDNTVLHPVINMPDELRPEKEFTVSVSEKNKKPMTYTLAIVDDGLLDLTAFKTPNAWSDFYARQALGVRTWDMFDMVVDAKSGMFGPLLSIGGDEALRPSNNPANRFKPVVKYLGPFTAKAGESQNHKITLPPYVGSVRVMVVAGNSQGAYGNADKTVQVKNPLMVLSTLPRVAGPDEEILLPVNVFAMDKKVKNVTVSVQSVKGLLQLTDSPTKTLTFNQVGDQVVYYKLKAASKVGVEQITIKATGGGEVSTETIEIEVRNPNPPILLTKAALVDAGITDSLNIAIESPTQNDWVKLEISRMPGVDLSKNLSYLRNYPYGCSEQVTSQVFPLLYVNSFMKFSEQETKKMNENINAGIKIITSRQLGDGGIAYWPGNAYPNEWVTSYAGHFLIEAQKKGYNVPESVINKWKQFQKKAAQRWNKSDLYNSYYSLSMSDLQQAYRLYTLALANDPELGAMNRLKEMNALSIQARWRLAAAYVLTGKKDAALQLINNVPIKIESYSSFNNTFGNTDRDMAMMMETNLLLGKVEKALSIAPQISEALSSAYPSTQTVAFGLIAMSQLAEKMGKGVIAYDWSLNGVKQTNKNMGSVFHEYTIKPQGHINVDFTNKGQGKLYVRLIGSTQPIVDKTPAQSNGINMYVKYTDDNGKDIDVSSLRQGTEFFANVIIQNISGEALTDLALNQIFPSGWEIFNTRLFSGDSSSTTSPYTYQDIRDDRVMTFFNLGYGYSTAIKIRLQAAYCGKFYLPAIACEAMYKPQINSRTEGMWVEVKQ